MTQAAVGMCEIKLFIWQLDAALEGFSGVAWIENVGKIARLKDTFLHKCRSAEATGLMPSPEEISTLARCFEALSQTAISASARHAVFDKAALMIEKLLGGGSAPEGPPAVAG